MINLISKVLGDPNERKVKKVLPIVEQINALEDEFSKLTDDELKAKTQEFIRVGYKKIAELEGLIAAAEKEIKQLKNELEQAIEELYKKYE